MRFNELATPTFLHFFIFFEKATKTHKNHLEKWPDFVRILADYELNLRKTYGICYLCNKIESL